MATLSRYCKAYVARDFQRFAGWAPRVEKLADEHVLYLHPNLCVTDGMYADEHVVFESSEPAWRDFCARELSFEIPEYARD